MLKLADDVRILTDLHNDVHAVNLLDWDWLYYNNVLVSVYIVPLLFKSKSDYLQFQRNFFLSR